MPIPPLSPNGPVLVTGATGFLGGALVEALSERGQRVLATGRDRHKLGQLASAKVQTVCMDLAAAPRADIGNALAGVSAIVHAAALSSPWGAPQAFMSANVAATQNLLAAAQAANVRRFIFISSPTVYFRFADQLGVSEDADLPPPVNDYARTKQMAERLVREAHQLEPVILRPRGLYGAGDTALLPRLIRAACSGPLPLFRDGAAVTDVTHVSDVVRAVLAALDLERIPAHAVFNISGGEPLPLKTIIGMACAASSVTPRWRRAPVAPALAAARALEALHRVLPGRPEPRVTAYGLGILAYSQTMDLTRARQSLGWTPRVSFGDGLERTFGGAR